jgi:hypothetical protein
MIAQTGGFVAAPGSDIVKKVRPADDDIIVTKHRVVRSRERT